jgi:TrmH family RNA methyltransferase
MREVGPRIKLVLVEPLRGINLGLIARLVLNFSVSQLIMVNPQLTEEELSEAYKFSSRAQEVVENAVVIDTLEKVIKDVDLAIATSAIYRVRGGNLRRRPVSLEEVISMIRDRGLGDIAIILGRETTGLRNEEIEMCDVMLSLETSENYPALNISNAAAIILYKFYTELYDKRKIRRKAAEKIVVDQIVDYFVNIASVVVKDERYLKHVKRAFKNIIGRSVPDYREAGILLNVFRKVYYHIRK